MPADSARANGARRATLRIATRGSPLARIQADRVASLLARQTGITTEIVVIRTVGDVDTTSPLSEVGAGIGGQGVFVRKIQEALLANAADIAVHSAKDLPSETPRGLVLASVPERADPRDALVGKPLDLLRAGATVATGSARRRAQLAGLRPDLTFVGLRGNMGTRVAESERVGAGVLAMAALDRLGLEGKVAGVLTTSQMLPQVGQGAIAVECREDDDESLEILRAIDDPDSHLALAAERAWLSEIGGGCSAPVAAHASVVRESPGGDTLIDLEAMIATHDGRIVLRRRATGTEPHELARQVAGALLDASGGSDLIAGIDGRADAGAATTPAPADPGGDR